MAKVIVSFEKQIPVLTFGFTQQGTISCSAARHCHCEISSQTSLGNDTVRGAVNVKHTLWFAELIHIKFTPMGENVHRGSKKRQRGQTVISAFLPVFMEYKENVCYDEKRK